MADLKPFFDSHKESGFPVNIRGLIESCGLGLNDSAELHNDIAGQIERLESNLENSNVEFKISTSITLTPEWKNFVMAHELGHYVLHESLIGAGLDDNVAFFSNPEGNYNNQNIGPKQEFEAHVFAAKVLMPELEVDRFFQHYLASENIDEEIQPNVHFGVPESVIAWWLGVLKEKSKADTLRD